ncbi:MAG: hypothetical protein U1E51_23350 [Candidatus Binatia bacterium]|nr:hypothetical protein [Candidatus Binatia bacterium]
MLSAVKTIVLFDQGLGPELTTNGDFSTNDLAGWTNGSSGTGSVDASTGSAVLISTDASNKGRITQLISGLPVGTRLRVQFDVVDSPQNAFVNMTGLSPSISSNRAVGHWSFDVQTTSTTPTWDVQVQSNNGQCVVDNFSARKR